MRNYIVQKAISKVEKTNISSYFVDDNPVYKQVHTKNAGLKSKPGIPLNQK